MQISHRVETTLNQFKFDPKSNGFRGEGKLGATLLVTNDSDKGWVKPIDSADLNRSIQAAGGKLDILKSDSVGAANLETQPDGTAQATSLTGGYGSEQLADYHSDHSLFGLHVRTAHTPTSILVSQEGDHYNLQETWNVSTDIGFGSRKS